MHKTIKQLTIGCLGFLSLQSCNDPNGPFVRDNDTPQRGNATIYVDDAFKPLFETANYTYNGIFPEAEILLHLTTETKALNALATEGIETIIISRDLTSAEKVKMRKAHIPVTSGILANDGVTFIVNNANTDTLFTQSEIKDLLTGKITTWKTSKKPLTVVFDGVESANFNYCAKLIGNAKFGANVKALKSNEEVIDYISKNPDAIGVIGFNYLSDTEDPIVKTRKENIQIAAIADKGNKNYWRPNQANLQEKMYPFTRSIYYITWAAADGLSQGFIRFMNGRQGQLLVDKCDLASGRGTPREINFTTQ